MIQARPQFLVRLLSPPGWQCIGGFGFEQLGISGGQYPVLSTKLDDKVLRVRVSVPGADFVEFVVTTDDRFSVKNPGDVVFKIMRKRTLADGERDDDFLIFKNPEIERDLRKNK